MSMFNAADDEQLVEFVAGRRILWDYSEKDFKNTLKKELIWMEIARLLNKTGQQYLDRVGYTKKRATYWHLLHFLDTVQHERSSFSNATESDIETAHVEENTHVPESEQIDEPFPSESNEGATSGAVSGNSSRSKRKVKRAFSKVGESSFELEGVQPKTKKMSNKQEIVLA
ncbi:hypothetical protein J6590_095521 [Homalodisca vitripennis]|nr:hypothetical protein J6590_095521 [Homalodisca vitripennis]